MLVTCSDCVFIPHSIDWMMAHPYEVATYYPFVHERYLITRVYTEGWYAAPLQNTFDHERNFESKLEIIKWMAPSFGIIIGLLLAWTAKKKSLSVQKRAFAH